MRLPAFPLSCIVWVLFLLPVKVSGHPLDPALLELVSHDGTFNVLWRAPLGRSGSTPLAPVLPKRCIPVSASTMSQAGGAVSQRWKVDCGKEGLAGERVAIAGLQERQTDAVVRIQTEDHRLIQTVLRWDKPFLTVAAGSTGLDVVYDYVDLGFRHILTGLDHLLFILGLVLLVSGRRLLLWTITSFTVGHSITLSLAILGFVSFSPKAVEVLIALSIFALAVELVRDSGSRVSWMRRFPWAAALLFGLLHGLGFAGALAQVGLPAEEIPLALVSFNTGIEIGQLLFVAMVIALREAFARIALRWPDEIRLTPAYLIGSLSSYWVFERAYTMIFEL